MIDCNVYWYIREERYGRMRQNTGRMDSWTGWTITNSRQTHRICPTLTAVRVGDCPDVYLSV